MALKLRAKVPFPATVSGTGGIKVEKNNGNWLISPDFSSLAALSGSAVSDPTTKQVQLFDPTSGQYNVLTLAGLGNALYSASSTTSLAIGTGSKTFVTQSGKDYAVGSWIFASSSADPTNFMVGQVTSYSSTSLVLNVTNIGGTGTHADWSLVSSAAPGPKGDTGAAGSMTGPGVSVDGEVALYNGTGGNTLKRASQSGIAKLTSGVLGTATSGTDYAPATSGSAILKGNGSGGFSSASAGTDYQAADAQLFSNIPQNSKSAAYTTVLTDAQKCIFHPAADTTARTWTIDSNANVAYPVGTVIAFAGEASSGNITLAITSDTLVWLPSGATGSRTLTAPFLCAIMKVTSTKWFLTGSGIT